LEVLPWATRAFDSSSTKRLVLEEEVQEGERVGDLFVRLASKYQGFGQIAFDPVARRLSGQVSVIYNGRLLELVEGLDTKLKDGDTLLLLPAFVGG
jgi:molybdopterin converting factor small subunit